MKNNILLFKASIVTAGIIMISSVAFSYFPYFGLWDESKIFEGLNDSEILSRSEQLAETRLFLEKYPNSKVKILWEHGETLYTHEQMTKTQNGEEKRTLDMQIKFDAFGNPSTHIIGCSGGNVSIGGFDDVLEKLESDWCFDGEIISIEYRK
jgi:hypothetical protein